MWKKEDNELALSDAEIAKPMDIQRRIVACLYAVVAAHLITLLLRVHLLKKTVNCESENAAHASNSRNCPTFLNILKQKKIPFPSSTILRNDTHSETLTSTKPHHNNLSYSPSTSPPLISPKISSNQINSRPLYSDIVKNRLYNNSSFNDHINKIITSLVHQIQTFITSLLSNLIPTLVHNIIHSCNINSP